MGLEQSGKSRLTTSWFDILPTASYQSDPSLDLVGQLEEKTVCVGSKGLG